MTHFKPVPDSDGLLRSKLGLNFRATRDYFRHDNLRLRCAAALTLTYELKAAEYLIDGTKKNRTNSKRFTNGQLVVAPCAAVATHPPFSFLSLSTDLAQINSKDIPFISGIRDRYNVNDTVSLNCTTTATKADISWYINGHRVSAALLSPLILNDWVPVCQVNSSQLLPYVYTKGFTVLGVRFLMEKRYFQTEELELRCVASFRKTIADFQEQVIIKTFNSEFLLSRNASSSSNCRRPLSPWPLTALLLLLYQTLHRMAVGRH